MRLYLDFLSPWLVFPAQSRPPWTAWSLPLLTLPLPLLLSLAYLLFTPGDTRLARRALLPVALFGILPMGFSHHFHGEHQFSDLNNFFALGCVIFVGQAFELALRTEAPRWVGWEGVGEKGSAVQASRSATSSELESKAAPVNGHTKNGHSNGHAKLPPVKEDLDMNVPMERLRMATRFLLTSRRLGFSPGLPPSFFHPHPQPVPRWQAVHRELVSLVTVYLVLDCILLPFSFHPHFRSIAGSQYGSLYAPVGGPIWEWIPNPVVSFGLTFLCGLSLEAVMILLYHAVALPMILLDPSPTASLYWPRLFQDPTGAASLTELWGKRWHQMFRAPLGFCGYELSHTLGFPRPISILATFLASSFLHYAAVKAQGFSSSTHGSTWALPLFFTMQGVGVVLEGAFKKLTGRRTGGWVGRVWVTSWVLWWGRGAMEVFARRGQAEGMSRGSLIVGRPVKWVLGLANEKWGWGLPPL